MIDRPLPKTTPVGRFAPSPTGRMHLGNIFTAVMSWASVKSRSGKWILRIEDLDPQRSRHEYARMIEDDLDWLGLTWDEGGMDDTGPHGPYSQSKRSTIYNDALQKLNDNSLLYRCSCTRSDILSAQAPHQSDGRIVYSGKCRPDILSPLSAEDMHGSAIRMIVEDRDITFTDMICGEQRVNLLTHCGDFVVRRADGVAAYQLAVVVDDALMGVTEVMRGDDLLLSTAQQLYLYEKLGYAPPVYAHLPLVRNEQGQRLSKRDKSLSMEALRRDNSTEDVLGIVAQLAGLQNGSAPTDLATITEKISQRLHR